MFGETGGFWDKRFGKDGYAYGTAPNDFLRAASAYLKPSLRVLCIGDGEGRNGVFLASQGHRVTTVDASAEGVKKATALALERGVALNALQGDLWSWQMGEGQWDAIVSIFCHLPSDLRLRVHTQAVAALRPGGAFVLEAYTPKQLQFGTGGPKDPDMLCSMEKLQTELRGMKFHTFQEVERDVVEGTFHSGRSAVVQVLGFKPRK